MLENAFKRIVENKIERDKMCGERNEKRDKRKKESVCERYKILHRENGLNEEWRERGREREWENGVAESAYIECVCVCVFV